ncbi:hypothetical protein V7S43_008669 [Phytophthora oleae]|uniref:Protein kinase domain-containing protein n=1 Tax=Phytophthora oleae TaxID=2107226 RepID=A0ABD3FI41_9STRA
MRSMPDLLVPGSGPMAEVLTTIGDLCDNMDETRQMCKWLHSGVKPIYDELRKKAIDYSPSTVERFVNIVAKFLRFLQQNHGKQLVYRVVEFSTRTTELRLIREEIIELFQELGTVPVNWEEEWDENYRLQIETLAATVKSRELVHYELQNPRARAAALLLLKFEMEQRGERHDDDVLRVLNSTLAHVISALNMLDGSLPPWFLPLYELEFESNSFARSSFSTSHHGWIGDHENVVIKFFLIDEEELDERAQRNLEKELSLIYPLSHRNIINILGASHVNSPPFVVYEFAKNGNLGTFLVRSEKNKNHLWRLLYEAACGLFYIHSQGIIHGYLKLSSILIDAKGHAKLTYYGLSTMRACSMLSHASTASSLRWRAPECLKRKPNATSDVYSLAMRMIEAANGEPPFAFLSDDDVRDNLRRGEIPDKPEAMTDEVWDLVKVMTNVDATKRIRLDEVLQKLEFFAQMEANGKLKTTETAKNFAPEKKNRTYTSVAALVGGIISSNSDKQEELLRLLVAECIEDEKRAELYESNGVSVLIDLVKSGRTHFVRLSSLLCLSWVVSLDLRLSKQDFYSLGEDFPELTPHELSDLKISFQDSDESEQMKALVVCSGTGIITKEQTLQDSSVLLPIVNLLRNGTDNLKFWATIAVGKLATNDKIRMYFADVGAVAPLLVLLQAGSPLQKLWAAYALAKLCKYNEINSISVANCGAIPLLMGLLHDGIPRQKEFAALSLGHFSLANENCSMIIASAGAIAPLVSLLRNGNGKQKERAAFALGGLMSRSMDNCTAIEVEGGLELLVSMLINSSDDQKEAAAFALGTFVAKGDVKANQVELKQAISYLVSTLSDGKTAQKELAALTLGTFSVGINVDSLAVEMEQAIVPLVTLLREGMYEQAAFALSHLAGMNDAIRVAIAQEGAILMLISLLHTGSDAAKEHAALVLGTLATNISIAEEIVREKGIPIFLTLLRDGTTKQKAYAMLAIGNLTICSNTNSSAIANEDGIPLIMALLRTGTEELTEGAAFALARLAANETISMLLVHNGAIPLFVELIQSDNDRLKEQAAFALSEIADKSYQNCEVIAAEGGIPLLVALLGAGTDKQKEFAAMTLSFICGEDELDDNRVAISRAGAIAPLVSLVNSGNDPQKRWAALALGSLAVKDDANCKVIAREGAISPLINLLRSPLDRQKENAAFALGRLAAYSDDADAISALEEAIPALVELLRAGTDAQKEEAAFALGHLSLKNEASSAAIASNGAISLLVKLLRSGTDNGKAYATMALVNLAASSRQTHAEVVHEGVIGLLVQIERNGAETQKRWAAYSLGRLAFKSHGH